MNSRTITMSVALFLTVLIPFWSLIPGIGYLLEIVTAIAIIMAVVEGRLWWMIGAVITSFIVGNLFMLSVMPPGLLLTTIVRAAAAPIVIGAMINAGRRAGLSFIVSSAVIGGAVMLGYLQIREPLGQVMDSLGAQLAGFLTGPLASQGYSPETILEIKDNLGYMVLLIKRLLPSLLVLSGIAQLFVAFVAVEWYYTRRDSYFPGFGSFVYWKAPEYLLYVLGIALIARLALSGVMQIVADNVLLLLSVVFCVCGLSLIEHLLRRLRLPLFIKIVFYFGLFIMQLPGFIMAAIAGLFDSYFDFRKVRAHTLG